jgi:hypothetical protein
LHLTLRLVDLSDHHRLVPWSKKKRKYTCDFLSFFVSNRIWHSQTLTCWIQSNTYIVINDACLTHLTTVLFFLLIFLYLAIKCYFSNASSSKINIELINIFSFLILPTLLLSIAHIQENTLSTHQYKSDDDTRTYRYEMEQLIKCSIDNYMRWKEYLN